MVIRINPASRSPTARNSAPEPAPFRPPMIEEKISGTSTMAIRARKIWPGKASQRPISSAIFGDIRPVLSLNSKPRPKPSTMPATTCAQSRLVIQTRSLKRWRETWIVVSGDGCVMVAALA